MLREFKEFAVRGNAVDMAVGIIIGGAFGALVGSMVKDVMMPPLGLLLGGLDFSNDFILLREGAAAGPYASLAAANEAGALTLNYGVFVNTVVNFLIVAFAVFMLVRAVNSTRRQQAAAPPPEPPAEERLLTEIRDLLKRRP